MYGGMGRSLVEDANQFGSVIAERIVQRWPDKPQKIAMTEKNEREINLLKRSVHGEPLVTLQMIHEDKSKILFNVKWTGKSFDIVGPGGKPECLKSFVGKVSKHFNESFFGHVKTAMQELISLKPIAERYVPLRYGVANQIVDEQFTGLDEAYSKAGRDWIEKMKKVGLEVMDADKHSGYRAMELKIDPSYWKKNEKKFRDHLEKRYELEVSHEKADRWGPEHMSVILLGKRKRANQIKRDHGIK